ncbi:MAG: HIT family protein [Pseudoxanthomonas suwonensis]|nr:HIT family protein [Pseudoxanthomonas suwonensis]
MDGWHLHPQLADDTHPVASFELCELRLMDDANYPWLILVPRIADASELIDLDAAQRHRLTDEIDMAARALRVLMQPDKLNVAALGNMVSQLHAHVIGRYRDDPAWPAPVWGRAAARPYAPEQLVERVAALQGAIASLLPTR